MESNRDSCASNIYLTVSSELLYGEGEVTSVTPSYDEVFQNSLHSNYISNCFNESGNRDNNHTNNSSNNYYNNVNIYESLRKKKESYLCDLINNATFSSPNQQTLPPSKKQKVKQILETEICKNKGKMCFIILLILVAMNTGTLICLWAQSTETNNAGTENKESYSRHNTSHNSIPTSKDYYPDYYYDEPWYKTDTGTYGYGCIKKNYKTLSHVNIEKINRSCDKVSECVKEIKKMATLPDRQYNFMVDQEGNIYKGLCWQCTMVSDTLVIGYFVNSDQLYYMDCSSLVKFFIHMPDVIKYGRIKGLLQPILQVTSDCYNNLVAAFFHTMPL